MFIHEDCVPRVAPNARGVFMGLLLLAGMLYSLSGCDTDIQSGIESANDLLYQKQYVPAERLYHKLLKRLEDSGSLDEDEDQQRLVILDRLGKINSLYLHDYNAAIVFYERLVKGYPRTEQAFAARATVADIYHHKLGNLNAAIEEYQKLVAEFPDREETRWAQLQISTAFFAQKDYEQARTEAETLINRWPDSREAAQARFQIANSFYVQARYTEAIATYERLLEGQPEPELASLVLFELGNCFQELDDSDRALAYYYACLSDHPNPMLVQRKISRVRSRLNKTRPAASIVLPEYVQKRLASVQSGTETAAKKPRPERVVAPESGVFSGSTFDVQEGNLNADAPEEPVTAPKKQAKAPLPKADVEPAGAPKDDIALAPGVAPKPAPVAPPPAPKAPVPEAEAAPAPKAPPPPAPKPDVQPQAQP